MEEHTAELENPSDSSKYSKTTLLLSKTSTATRRSLETCLAASVTVISYQSSVFGAQNWQNDGGSVVEQLVEIAGADGFLQGDQKDLMTPGFPEQNYPNAALCQVCAVFVEVFDTLCQCLPPFIIRIISVKAKFCGRTKPKPVESNSNIMVLRFEFDITLNSKGFRATYIRFRPVVASTTTQSPTTSKTQASSLPTTTASGGPIILQGCEGVIQSVGFPNPYPAHLNSSWKISVPKGFLVKLQIPEMAITGETGQCKEDKFVILDRYSVLGTHCGYILPPVMISPSDTISVTFQSDNRLTDRGFSAKWEAVYPEDIGGTKHSHTGTHSQLRHMLLKHFIKTNYRNSHFSVTYCRSKVVAKALRNLSNHRHCERRPSKATLLALASVHAASGCGGLKDLNGIGGTVSSMGDPEATTTKLTASGTSRYQSDN
ncbi:Tolloid-like protein 2 [Channa argus]|uniref:Tolloid-like protein 2 n=1 Tax=Channa argus TaxID=215402 RepID=A0A6G1PCD7_CHAAH|nr:Tolloid-like protein 2 [Channa argus]